MARVSISVSDEIVARAKGAQLNISSELGEVAIATTEIEQGCDLVRGVPRASRSHPPARPEVVEPIHVLVALA